MAERVLRRLRPHHGVVALALLLGAMLSADVAIDLHRDYHLAIESAAVRSRHLTRVLEEHARQTLSRVDASLTQAAAAVGDERAAGGASGDALRRRLIGLLPTDGLIPEFALARADGTIIASTATAGRETLGAAAARAAAEAHRQAVAPRLFVGACIAHGAQGRPMVPIGIALAVPGGAMHEVLVALVDTTPLQRFYDSVGAETGGSVALFARSGWVVVRSPFDGSALTRSWADSPMFSAQLAASAATPWRRMVGAGDVEHLYSHRTLADYPVVVSLGLSLTDALAPWRLHAQRSAILLTLMLAALGGAALVLARQLRRREVAEVELKRLTAIIELTTDVVATGRVDGQLVYLNAAGRRALGVGRDEDVTRYTNQQFDDPERWAYVQQVARPAAVKNGVWSGQRQLPGPDGRTIEVSQVIVAHLDASGNPEFYTGISRDVTERVQAERKLAALAAGLEAEVASRTEELSKALAAASASDRVKAEFLANVTHELKTPLNSIIGFAELLRDEVPGPLNAKQAEFVADIVAGGGRLLALVEGILDMSRLTAGGLTLQHEPVAVEAALEASVTSHRQAAEARGIAIGLDVTADVGTVGLDRWALRRMLDALIDNAIKFNHAGGTVSLRARRTEHWLEIAVVDTGIGIAKADLLKLFRPLAPLDAGLDRRHGGIGLGLILARKLAVLHGGSIEVDSGPGAGSTFTLRLPIAESP